MTSHPLESEELIVTVSVVHVASASEGVGQAPAGTMQSTVTSTDGVYAAIGETLDIHKATEDALQVALDRLLAQVEIQGGG